jgi:hypothetical protein
MNRFYYLGWAVMGALLVLAWWSEVRTDSRLARLLHSSRGPSPERAPFAFLRFGAMMLVPLIVLLYSLVSVKPGWVQTALIVLMPFLLFPAAMGIGGGLYLLVRRWFSRRG